MSNEVKVVVKSEDKTDFKPIERKADTFLGSMKHKFKTRGDEGAESFSIGFATRVGPLLAKAPVGPHLLAGIAAAAPAASALISAAVTGGVAMAPVGAGIALAFRDPRVKAEARALGESAMNVLTRASGSFIEETRQGIGILRSGIESQETRLTSIFDKASQFVVPLADGFSEGAQELLESVDVVVGRAGPVIEVFEYHIPRAMDSAGEALETFSKNAEFNADTLSAALTSVEFSIEHVANATNFLSEVGKISAVGALIDMTDGFRGNAEAADDAASSYKDAAMELKSYAEEVKAQTDPAFALIKAQRELKESQDAYNEAVKEHGRNSPEARAALMELAQASVELSGAVAEAEGTFTGGLSPALRATLRAAGVTEKQIAELEKEFGKARRAGDAFAKTYTANVVVRYREVGRAVPIYGEYQSGIGGRAMGGVVGAQDGRMSGGWTMTGEAGKELLKLPPGTQVMSNPDTERMLSGGGFGGGGMPIVIQVMPTPGGGDDMMDEVVRNLRFRVRTEGSGSSQTFFGDG